MSRIFLRLGVLCSAAALLLTSCAPAAGPAGSEGDAENKFASSSMMEELPAVTSGQIQELVAQAVAEVQSVPRPVLTQADIDQALTEVMENYSAAAVSVATVECGQLSQSGAWGWAVKGDREMTPDTKLRIASISKVVVGMCALSMAEEGIVDLDAPLSDYWGAGVRNPYSKGQPSVRTLMTHSSSVKDLEITRGLTHIRGLLQSGSSWRSMEPGNGGYWYYSNFGLCVLGTTLELAYDGLLEDYLQQHFLKPIGAEASFFAGTLDPKQLGIIYSGGSVGLSLADQINQVPPSAIGQSASYFPGGFTVSAVDMAKLVSILVNDGVYKGPAYTLVVDAEPGEEKKEYILVEKAKDDGQQLSQYAVVDRGMEEVQDAETKLYKVKEQYTEVRLLSEESVADMETPRFTVDPIVTSPFEQCLILRRQEDILGQSVLYYHTGSAYGVFTLMTYNPETKNGVVVLTTGTSRNMNERGLYALCADLSEKLYEKMEVGPI